MPTVSRVAHRAVCSTSTGSSRRFIERLGNPEVVDMTLKDFLKTIAPEPEVLQAIRAEAKRKKTSKLTSRQIDREITAYRRERRLSNIAYTGR